MRIALSLMTLRFFFTVRQWRKAKGAGMFHMVQPVSKAIWAASFRVFQCVLFFSVVIFMYAIVGMAAFGNTRHGYAGDGLGGNPARSSGNLNADANFESFPKAIFTLYRTITGENWCMLLLDLCQGFAKWPDAVIDSDALPSFSDPGPGATRMRVRVLRAVVERACGRT